MNFASIESIANAILFEGYILYPYRSSAIKKPSTLELWHALSPRFCSSPEAP
jgi:hypothetical protein